MEYAFATLKHKWFVLLAGLHLGGIPLIRLLAHDWHKFTPAEYPYYQRQFFGDKGDPQGFAYAWLHHQNTAPHHWEYFITRSDHSKGSSGAVDGCLEMPETYVREMVVDWLAASRTYTGRWNIKGWFIKNFSKIKLHPNTEKVVRELLEEIDYGEQMERIEKAYP